jgi:hypothetical protein
MGDVGETGGEGDEDETLVIETWKSRIGISEARLPLRA